MTGRRRALRILAAAPVLGAAALLPARGATRPREVLEWRGVALGAEARILLAHPRPEAARAAVKAAVAEIARLEDEFSLFRPGSALSRLNRDGRLDRPSLDMRRLLEQAQRFGALTGGAFDVTVQPLWRLFARHGGAPPEAAVAAALPLVDHRAIEIGPARVRLAREGMAVTLNGIAQGYITDRVAEILAEVGMPAALVDAGELRILATGPGGRPWRVTLAHPAAPPRTIALDHAAVATSAGRGSPFTADARAHHILDPRSGACPQPDRAVSVIAPSATAADALATALTLLPEPMAEAALRAAGGARAILTEPGRPPRELGGMPNAAHEGDAP